MKKIFGCFALTALLVGTVGCEKDKELETTDVGPVMTVVSRSEQAIMGDSIRFEVTLQDPIALSTLRAELYFDEEKVAETQIRTKENGTYDGAIPVPYYQDIEDGTATLRLMGQNVQFGLTTQDYDVAVSRPDPESLTFVTEEGEYTATRTEAYTYALTEELPQAISGYFRMPAFESGKVLTFGWDATNKVLAVGSTEPIPYTNLSAGEWTITVNIKTFATEPFLVPVKLGDQYMETVAEGYALTLDLEKDATLTLSGLENVGEYTADVDYFELTDGSLKVLAPSGNYRTVVDTQHKYITAEVYKDGAPASLQDDCTGALWIVGEKIGKPSLDNEVGWTTEKALCMVPVEPGKFRITLVGGTSVGTTSINFKFYGEAKGWGNEFKHDRLTSASDLVGVGTGDVDETGEKHDDGNLYLKSGVTLEEGVAYWFTVDMTAGQDQAVLTVEKAGEESEEDPYLVEVEQIDENTLAAMLQLTKGKKIGLSGFDLTGWWVDDNYLAPAADGTFTVKVVDGKYRITAHKDTKQLRVQRVNMDGSDVELQSDGTGGIWMMAWGLGVPSQDAQFGFTEGAAYCMAEVEPAIYRLTGKAGPEKGSAAGDYFRYDYLSFKYFHQNGWGGEMTNPTLAEGTEKLLKLSGSNLELADGVTLEQGATYQLTIDLTAGKDKPVVSLVKL